MAHGGGGEHFFEVSLRGAKHFFMVIKGGAKHFLMVIEGGRRDFFSKNISYYTPRNAAKYVTRSEN